MRHPSEFDLALLAGGELPPWTRWRLTSHLRRCPSCQAAVEGFRQAREWTRTRASQMPAEVSWNRLAIEMKANIRLGLEAGECVGPATVEPVRHPWRVAAALASITVVAFSGWLLQLPAPNLGQAREQAGIVLEATASGIGLKENGRELTLLHQPADQVTLSVGVEGSLRARYVDRETGQVTIHHVFAQ